MMDEGGGERWRKGGRRELALVSFGRGRFGPFQLARQMNEREASMRKVTVLAEI